MSNIFFGDAGDSMIIVWIVKILETQMQVGLQSKKKMYYKIGSNGDQSQDPFQTIGNIDPLDVHFFWVSTLS